ncbi:MAG: MFS transporter [Candidatus Lokiarchaeota archaeon]|nr:MFS transporter [Candidatus Lokiarchaeota archaeon]MBD3342440.1 MFS transporter [Candidatus Lokiarchaeota archaeon]
MSKLDALAKKKAEARVVEPRSKKYMIYLVIFMGMVSMMDQYCSLIEGPIVPYILVDYGITASEFAFLQGIYGLITFACFFIAWIADAYGRKKAMLVLMLSMGIPALLIGLVSFTIHLFFIFYAIVIMGTLSNLWELPITEEAKPEKRGTLGGLVFLIGLIPVYAIVGSLIADTLGWRWAYGVMFFYMLIILIPMWFLMKETKRWEMVKEDRGVEVFHIKDAFKSLNRKDLTYILASTIIYTTWTAVFKLGATWGGYYYMNIQGLTSDEFRILLTIGGLLTMVGAISSGILMDKLGRNPTLVISCLGAVVGFVFLGLTGFPIFFWMIYYFMPMVLAWIMVYFAEIFPTDVRGTCTGICTTTSRISYVIGPLLASVLLIFFPDMLGFWIIAGLLMLLPLLSLLLKPYETKGKTLEEIEAER